MMNDTTMHFSSPTWSTAGAFSLPTPAALKTVSNPPSATKRDSGFSVTGGSSEGSSPSLHADPFGNTLSSAHSSGSNFGLMTGNAGSTKMNLLDNDSFNAVFAGFNANATNTNNVSAAHKAMKLPAGMPAPPAGMKLPVPAGPKPVIAPNTTAAAAAAMVLREEPTPTKAIAADQKQHSFQFTSKMLQGTTPSQLFVSVAPGSGFKEGDYVALIPKKEDDKTNLATMIPTATTAAPATPALMIPNVAAQMAAGFPQMVAAPGMNVLTTAANAGATNGQVNATSTKRGGNKPFYAHIRCFCGAKIVDRASFAQHMTAKHPECSADEEFLLQCGCKTDRITIGPNTTQKLFEEFKSAITSNNNSKQQSELTSPTANSNATLNFDAATNTACTAARNNCECKVWHLARKEFASASAGVESNTALSF